LELAQESLALARHGEADGPAQMTWFELVLRQIIFRAGIDARVLPRDRFRAVSGSAAR
jgi:hypothetical protein